MLLALLITLSAQAACVEVVPYKQIGKLKISAELPAGFKENRDPGFSADSIRTGEGYRFDTDDKGRVNFIQRELEKTGCALIKGKRLKPAATAEQIKKSFPGCDFDLPEGGGSFFQCDGFALSLGNHIGGKFRITVSKDDRASVKAMRIENNSRQILQQESKKYPWIKK